MPLASVEKSVYSDLRENLIVVSLALNFVLAGLLSSAHAERYAASAEASLTLPGSVRATGSAFVSQVTAVPFHRHHALSRVSLLMWVCRPLMRRIELCSGRLCALVVWVVVLRTRFGSLYYKPFLSHAFFPSCSALKFAAALVTTREGPPHNNVQR